MLLDHKTAFADFTAIPQARREQVPGFAAQTLVETASGWRPAGSLRPGDHVATVDGGFRPLVSVTRTRPLPLDHWCIPGGTFGTCSDLVVSARHHLAIRHPACRRLFGLPLVVAPVSALGGFRGIARSAAPDHMVRLGLAEEELLWAQTGAMVLAPGQDGARHYQRLDYGQTRALLLMIEPACAPDLAA